MIDPASTWVGPDATVGRDTVIYPATMIMGATEIGEECTVGPNTRLMNVRVGNFSVIDETVAEDVQIDDYVNCGPARLPAARHAPVRPQQGRHARRDQEVDHRGGLQVAAPLLHR